LSSPENRNFYIYPPPLRVPLCNELCTILIMLRSSYLSSNGKTGVFLKEIILVKYGEDVKIAELAMRNTFLCQCIAIPNLNKCLSETRPCQKNADQYFKLCCIFLFT